MFKVMVTLLSALLLTVPNISAFAGTYPDKPIMLVVPFRAGGFSDVIARYLADKLGRSLGQRVLVEDRPGASGNIGAEYVAKAKPDGYTLLVSSGNFATSPSLNKVLPFDAIKDFEPITLISKGPMVLTANPASPIRSVQDLVAITKSRPGQLNYATSGRGTGGSLAMELLKQRAKINMVEIAYKGGAANAAAVLGGEVATTLLNIPAGMSFYKSGQLRAVAVTSLQRSPALPDVPTVAESGFPGFEIVGWLGLAAPAGTPKPIIHRLNAEIVKILAQPDTRKYFRAQGERPIGDSPDEFGKFVEMEITKWAKIIKSAGIQPR